MSQRHKDSNFFPSCSPPSRLGDFDKDQNPNSETLHAILLFQENQELLQFADAYVLIPFSMKKRPSAVCNKGYVSTWWLFSHLARASGEGREACVPGLGFDSALEAFVRLSVSQGASIEHALCSQIRAGF